MQRATATEIQNLRKTQRAKKIAVVYKLYASTTSNRMQKAVSTNFKISENTG